MTTALRYTALFAPVEYQWEYTPCAKRAVFLDFSQKPFIERQHQKKRRAGQQSKKGLAFLQNRTYMVWFTHDVIIKHGIQHFEIVTYHSV